MRRIAGDLHVRMGGTVVIERTHVTLSSAGGAFFRASGALAMADDAKFVVDGISDTVRGRLTHVELLRPL